jgi:hypothetical protein
MDNALPYRSALVALVYGYRLDKLTRLGDQWTFVALDPDTKLVPAFRVGKRRRPDAVAFMTDLSERVANRVQISSDALNSHVDAVERAFGTDVDYGQAVKFYDAEPIGPGRYAPLRIVSQQKIMVAGSPLSATYLDKPCGTSKSDDAYVHAPLHAPNQCFQ